MSERRLAYRGGKSDKFWTISVNGASYTVHFGRRGTAGQRKTKTLESGAEASVAAAKLVRSKLKKGYTEADQDATPRPAAPVVQSPAANALMLVLTLAGLGETKLADRFIAERFRTVVHFTSFLLVFRYDVGESSPHCLHASEARALLGVEVQAGDTIEVPGDLVSLHELLIALLDPNLRVFERAAAITGVAADPLRDALADLGLDLARRTINGQPWTKLPISGSCMAPTVVERAADPTQLSLNDARRLKPDAEVGDRMRFPNPAEALTGVISGLPDLNTKPQFAEWIGPDGIERRRATQLRIVPTPDCLARDVREPLHPMYCPPRGVLWFECNAAHSFRLWSRLDRGAHRSGYRPVLMMVNAQQRGSLWSWQRDDSDGLQAGAHSRDSPCDVLSQVDRVDVAALLQDGGNPSYPHVRIAPGGKSDARPTAEPQASIIALIPTDAAWKTIAWLTILHAAGEATPSMTQVAAVSRHWERTHGARILGVGPATIFWKLDQPVRDLEGASNVARERFNFSPEGSQDTLAGLTSEVQRSGIWRAWWD